MSLKQFEKGEEKISHSKNHQPDTPREYLKKQTPKEGTLQTVKCVQEQMKLSMVQGQAVVQQTIFPMLFPHFPACVFVHSHVCESGVIPGFLKGGGGKSKQK